MNVLWEYENRLLADVSTGGNGVARWAMLLLTSQVPCEMQAFSVDPFYGGAETAHASLERMYAARVLWTTVRYLKKTRFGLERTVVVVFWCERTAQGMSHAGFPQAAFVQLGIHVMAYPLV